MLFNTWPVRNDHQTRNVSSQVKYRRVVPEQTADGYDSSTYASSSRDRSDPLYDRRTWPQP